MINKMNDSKNTSMSCVNGYNWTVILFCCESPTDRYRVWDCFVVSCNWKEQFHQQIKIRWLTMCLDCCWFGLQWLGCLWNFLSCRASVVSSVFCGRQKKFSEPCAWQTVKVSVNLCASFVFRFCFCSFWDDSKSMFFLCTSFPSVLSSFFNPHSVVTHCPSSLGSTVAN